MRIARPAIFGSGSKPSHRQSGTSEKRVSGADRVLGMMEVDVSLSLLQRGVNVGFRPSNVTCLGMPDRADAGDDAAAIFWMRLQVPVDQGPGFLIPSGVLQS